jgi:hypothetical protein
VFWSTLYLWVAALSGIQQEVSRASRPAPAPITRASPLRLFAAMAALVASLAAIVFSLLLGDALVAGGAWWMAVALPLGLIGYVFSASLGGVLYGLHIWTAVAFTTIADALLRALLVLPGLAFHVSTELLALLVALPFVLAFALTWLVFRKRVIGRFDLDVGLRSLTWNATSTVAAASASGLMISGLPMLIGATSAHISSTVTGSVLLTITLTRAPIVIPVIALQSFLITGVFRDGRIRQSAIAKLVAVGTGALVILAAAGWVLGPFLVSLISGGRFSIEGWLIAVIVISAGLTAAMCTTGPALIAMRRHTANVVGWLTAAALTIIALLLPLEENARITVALIVPVVIGLIIHALALGRARPRSGQ